MHVIYTMQNEPDKFDIDKQDLVAVACTAEDIGADTIGGRDDPDGDEITIEL